MSRVRSGMAPYAPLAFDAWLTEEELAERFLAALRTGRLPELFFYWSPLSVRAWLALCGKGPYRNYRRSMALVRKAAAACAAALPRGPVQVVSLGAGQGDKDLLLLRALRAGGREPVYTPLDASQALLELAMSGAAAEAFACRGAKAEFADPRPALSWEGGPPRLVLLLGNTLGCDPRGLARAASRLLRPGDRLLVDGELAGPGTLAGYDNPLNRRFAYAPFAAAGVRPEDGKLHFRLSTAGSGTRPPGGGLLRVTKRFECSRPVRLRLGGAEVTLPRRVEMSPSYKYTPAAFHRTLAQAGLAAEREWRGERFRLVLARRS